MNEERQKMKEYYFLREDIQGLEKQIRDLTERLQALSIEMHEATTQSSEIGHDNFPFEEALRQYRVTGVRLKELSDIRRNAAVIEPSTSDAVSIGKTVTVKDLANGEMKTFRVGSFMVFTRAPDEEDVAKDAIESFSYEAPFVKIVMGAKAGETRSGTIGGRERKLQVVSLA